MVRNPVFAPGSALVLRKEKAGHVLAEQLAGFSVPLHIRQCFRMASRGEIRRALIVALLYSLLLMMSPNALQVR